ncbi:MAG: N-acetylmuramoyl-L-alanine amidase [Bacteroidales bacterium]|nr:N-acetylmuramoyl-L-alanine amidase [Bacteroidales bacterium]
MIMLANIVPFFQCRFRKTGLLLIVVGLLFPITSMAQKGSKISTIVIDAGHGGKDPGASGKHSREKDITLKVALKLGRYISQNLKDVKVIYTRKTDVFIPLYKRAEIANDNHADVFISIHCNSNPSTKAYGAESYVIGLFKTKDNLMVAEKENEAIRYEDNAKERYGSFDLNSPQSYINLSLFQNLHLSQSLQLAHDIEGEFKSNADRKARGVYQAGFLVLWQTTMPSVLVELGFLTNPKEEKYLLSNKGQSELAYSIYLAFKKFKTTFERENNVKPPAIASRTNDVVQPKQRLEYRVQFYASIDKVKDVNKKFKGVSSVSYYQSGKYYKYTAGHFNKINEAVNYRNLIRKKGFKDAFVVVFLDRKRISFKEAQKYLPGK